MLVNTHWAIGSYCYKLCNEKYNLNLNKKRFLAGCVEPDLHKRGNKIKHTYSVSKDKMLEYKDYIENNDLDINEVSFIIGKIAHYIADCFCKYHLEEYYGKDMKNHFAYEVALHLMLRKTLRNNKDIFENILENIDDSIDYLEELKINRQEYLSLEEDCINDIFYTIKTTCQLLYLTKKYFIKVSESYI
ncbi:MULTISPECIES: zinc dependent phospholipase C family protein [Clostridia]|jgi:hypothetical protein|uniref:Zinc dependent phospholipase C family protein n=1 Tax=Clostridium saudiense TaxID=1414720 RepID=A0ABS2FFH6_9CLOT|nr:MULTISPECIES: zinc dependent phospholipase C family protein [Clostridiaceae]MBM6819305.1 zinc dependent phospholipase C family protein [Clostridium saudiense]